MLSYPVSHHHHIFTMNKKFKVGVLVFPKIVSFQIPSKCGSINPLYPINHIFDIKSYSKLTIFCFSRSASDYFLFYDVNTPADETQLNNWKFQFRMTQLNGNFVCVLT